MYINIHNASDVLFRSSGKRTVGKTSGNYIKIEGGEGVFFEGDDVCSIFEVVKGVLRTSKVLKDGRRQIISFHYCGDLVGYAPSAVYRYDCDAITPTILCAYGQSGIEQTLCQEPAFCRQFFHKTIIQMDRLQQHFIMLGRKSAFERVATFLCYVMVRDGVKTRRGTQISLPMKRVDIADFLGLTVETVSRQLSELKRQKLVVPIKASRFIVPSPRKLQVVAEQALD